MRYELIVSRYVNLSFRGDQDQSCVPQEDQAYADFKARVNDALANGAILHGSTTMTMNISGYAIFAQAVLFP